jgi:hypothetical protein
MWKWDATDEGKFGTKVGEALYCTPVPHIPSLGLVLWDNTVVGSKWILNEALWEFKNCDFLEGYWIDDLSIVHKTALPTHTHTHMQY